MTGKFLYVFRKEDCQTLLKLQYTLMAADERNGIYVFLNREPACFNTETVRFAYSDTLPL